MDPASSTDSANSAGLPQNRAASEVPRQNMPRPKPVYYHPNSVQAEAVTPEPAQAPAEQPTPRKFEPLPSDYHKNKDKKGRWIVLGVIILIVVMAAVYWFLLRSKPAKAPTTTTSSSSTSAPASLAVTPTTNYNSSNLSLSFDYPKDWKIADVSGSGVLTATSPTTKLKNADGQQVDGQILMVIRTKTQSLPEFSKGGATAVLNSQKITYTKPTQTQRASTYISFLNYASSSATGIDGIYITSDNGYQKGQAVPQTDITKENPLIDISFTSSSKAVTIATSSWSDSSFSKPLVSMLESLALQ